MLGENLHWIRSNFWHERDFLDLKHLNHLLLNWWKQTTKEGPSLLFQSITWLVRVKVKVTGEHENEVKFLGELGSPINIIINIIVIIIIIIIIIIIPFNI